MLPFPASFSSLLALLTLCTFVCLHFYATPFSCERNETCGKGECHGWGDRPIVLTTASNNSFKQPLQLSRNG